MSRAKSMRINKMITKRKIFDLLSNSLNQFFKEMYGDQSGELYVDIGACRVNCYTFTVSYCFKITVKPRFIKGQPLNMDNSLIQTVCFVPGKKIGP